MSAIKLIRKVGIGCAKANVEGAFELSKTQPMDLHKLEIFGIVVDVFELKRLVGAHEHLEKLGGLSKAKDHLDYLISHGSWFAGVNKQMIEELTLDISICEQEPGAEG
ncbi:hypothetical protein SJZ78_03065 [Acinetobacter baumannii]|nr:hypothetical protein [Acinetobacter baumannii]MDX7905400.1 hypothetical protein [Acinetobacter baumannii]MDX7925145.1 hypothetical protein [Acinetobacter baumannii]